MRPPRSDASKKAASLGYKIELHETSEGTLPIITRPHETKLFSFTGFLEENDLGPDDAQRPEVVARFHRAVQEYEFLTSQKRMPN